MRVLSVRDVKGCVCCSPVFRQCFASVSPVFRQCFATVSPPFRQTAFPTILHVLAMSISNSFKSGRAGILTWFVHLQYVKDPAIVVALCGRE